MINWKTSIGLSLFMIAGVEFLKIKDNYHPDGVDLAQVLLMTAFVLSVAIGTTLMLTGLRRRLHR